ncbi:hypothetical protein OT109_15550 [Phycisphaeraceae bacterium D3-23]
MTAGPSPEISNLAEAIANRVRLIQVDFADEPADKRHAFLADEIERALSDQTPSRRRALLDELIERFPTWNAQMLAKQGEPTDHEDELASSGVHALLDRLIELAPEMSSDDRLTVYVRLEEAGLIAKQHQAGWSLNAEEAALQKLGFSKDGPLDADRVLQLLVEQTQFMSQIARIVRATWQELSPRSAILPSAELTPMIEQFITGDADISRSQVGDEMERTRRLTAAMIAAIGRLGQVLSEKLTRELGAAVLEQAARQDKRWHEGVEVAAWRVYKERAELLDETELDREIRRLLVEYTESVARGMG